MTLDRRLSGNHCNIVGGEISVCGDSGRDEGSDAERSAGWKGFGVNTITRLRILIFWNNVMMLERLTSGTELEVESIRFELPS